MSPFRDTSMSMTLDDALASSDDDEVGNAPASTPKVQPRVLKGLSPADRAYETGGVSGDETDGLAREDVHHEKYTPPHVLLPGAVGVRENPKKPGEVQVGINPLQMKSIVVARPKNETQKESKNRKKQADADEDEDYKPDESKT